MKEIPVSQNRPYGLLAGQPRGTAAQLPMLNLEKMVAPEHYMPDEGLVDAVNVALILRQPLLLTGEPGTGKTQLAYNVAWQLGLQEPLQFEAKSTSVSRDLFYTFDNIGRFQAAQTADTTIDPREFIQFNALGKAILHTLSPEQAARITTAADSLPQTAARSIVLIDEIDKAPRDFPNDILNELENLYFRIPELGGETVHANPDLPPIVIMTSNSEKSLPDPFLRRCIFYNIPFPKSKRLEEIVLSRVVGLDSGKDGALTGMLDFYGQLRQDGAGLRKKPGTAELLNWATALVAAGIDAKQPFKSQINGLADRTLSTLSKDSDDQEKVRGLLSDWSRE